jgi:hypothetical protein
VRTYLSVCLSLSLSLFLPFARELAGSPRRTAESIIRHGCALRSLTSHSLSLLFSDYFSLHWWSLNNSKLTSAHRSISSYFSPTCTSFSAFALRSDRSLSFFFLFFPLSPSTRYSFHSYVSDRNFLYVRMNVLITWDGYFRTLDASMHCLGKR